MAPTRQSGAIVAVAHSILVIAYHVLRDGQSYHELGGDYFDQMSTARLTRYHTRRLAALGYAVTLTRPPDADPTPPSVGSAHAPSGHPRRMKRLPVVPWRRAGTVSRSVAEWCH